MPIVEESKRVRVIGGNNQFKIGDIFNVKSYPGHEYTHYEICDEGIYFGYSIKISRTELVEENSTSTSEFNFALIAVGS
jgi:hypothetical protein